MFHDAAHPFHLKSYTTAKTDTMNKIITALALAAFALGAQAASHAGGAPMKAEAAKPAASAASGAKHAAKKDAKHDGMKDAKKEEAKK